MKFKYYSYWLAVFAFLFIFLQEYSKYHFYFIEQSQLFQLNWDYIAAKLILPGGLSLIFSEFLVQFFILPYAGAAIVALLLTLVGMWTAAIVKRIAPLSGVFILSLLSIIALLFMHFDFNYLVAGTVAYIMLLKAIYGYLLIKNYVWRTITGVCLVFLLYWLAGPVALLFALTVLMYELLGKTFRFWSVLIAFEAVLLAVCSVYFSYTGEYRLAFLPDAYYHLALNPKPVIYYSWYCLPIVLIIAFLLGKRKSVIGKKRKIGEGVLQVIILVALCWWGIPKYGDEKSLKVKKMDYYTRTEQWDKIIASSQGSLTNYLNLCYLNMALSQKGELADCLFSFDQKGPLGLVVAWNQSEQISGLLSEVAFTMGNIAYAQEMAFEAYVTAMGGGSPRMLKRLVQTNLIYGEYPVAEKYLNLLDRTLFYRQWANEQRKFLYNDAEVEKDPLLGLKRRGLPKVNYLSEINGTMANLKILAEANPSNSIPIRYLGAFYLLSKDLTGFKSLVELYYGTDVLPVLPKSFQEAIITLSEGEPDYWKRYNISESVMSRFGEFKKQVLANKNNPSALPGLMRRTYGDSYWFYFMFK